MKVGCWHQRRQFGVLEYALRFSPANPISQRHSGRISRSSLVVFLVVSASCLSVFVTQGELRPRHSQFSTFTNGRCFHGHVPAFGKFDTQVFAELAGLVVEMSEDRCGELFVVQLQVHRMTNLKHGRKTRSHRRSRETSSIQATGQVMQINLAKMLSSIVF